MVGFALHLPQSHNVGVGHSVTEVGRACDSLSRLHPVAIRRKDALRSLSLAVLILMSQVTVRGRFESHNLLVTCRIRRVPLDVVGQSIGRHMLEPLVVLLVTFKRGLLFSSALCLIVVVHDSLLGLTGLLLRRGHERLLHTERVVQGGVVTSVVRMLTRHLVQSLRVEKDLVGSLR